MLLRAFCYYYQKTYVLKNQVEMKSDIVLFARNRYTVTVNGKFGIPLLFFVVPSIADFRSNYRKMAENPISTFVWQF